MFRLSIPIEILWFDSSKFKNTDDDGKTISWKYEQKLPFYYSVFIDACKNTTYIEFSGKSLLERYPELIDASNFSYCIENINAQNVVYMHPKEVMEKAIVIKSDVTCDIVTNYTISDLYSNLQLNNNKAYTITTTAANRFTIENTAVTARCRERLLVYDKQYEMCKGENKSFLSTVSNANDILNYYKNKIRLELNIKSTDRVRHFFETADCRLKTILNSGKDPIKKFLYRAVAVESAAGMIKKYSYKLRDAERLLLLCLCGFDMTTLEKTIRNIVGSNRSIKNIMEPYRALYSAIACNLSEGDTSNFDEVQNNLIAALSRLGTDTSSTTLIELYQNHKLLTEKKSTINNDGLFSISHVVMPP